jgi:hypothetical protein
MLRLSACKDDIATPHSEKRVDRRGDRVIPLKDAWSGSAQVTEQQKCVQIPITVSAFSLNLRAKHPVFAPMLAILRIRGEERWVLLLHWGVTSCRIVPD